MLPLQPSVSMERHLSIHTTGSEIHCVLTMPFLPESSGFIQVRDKPTMYVLSTAGISCNSIESAQKRRLFDSFQVLSVFCKSPASQSRSAFVKSNDVVMPKSQPHIAAIH